MEMDKIELKDFIAAHVVQGILANEGETLQLLMKDSREKSLEQLASAVWEITEAIIKERNKRNDR